MASVPPSIAQILVQGCAVSWERYATYLAAGVAGDLAPKSPTIVESWLEFAPSERELVTLAVFHHASQESAALQYSLYSTHSGRTRSECFVLSSNEACKSEAFIFSESHCYTPESSFVPFQAAAKAIESIAVDPTILPSDVTWLDGDSWTWPEGG